MKKIKLLIVAGLCTASACVNPLDDEEAEEKKEVPPFNVTIEPWNDAGEIGGELKRCECKSGKECFYPDRCKCK